MKVTTIKVAYSLTYNLGDYSNVRPSVELTADIEPGDDEPTTRLYLMDAARAQVEQEVDLALEQRGDPPHFYAGPRYVLRVDARDKLAALVKVSEVEQLPAPWGDLHSRYYNHRREYILAQCNNDGLTLIEPVDGNYNILPALKEFTVIRHVAARLIALVPDRMRGADLRGMGDWWTWATYDTQIRLSSYLAAEIQDEAVERDLKFYDCRDGDLGRLPTLNRPHEPVVADDDHDDDPEDDDDTDWDDND